ncbi:MAG: zinc ribbon domain-containing protein [Clostridia bacterium]|nr:zinc ribbon domain-containing protein [Clostridia bacterium]
MICNNCGANIPDGSTFCTNCGASVAPAQTAQPVYAPASNGIKTVSPGKVLTWGILGLAFAELGILGLIFSIIGLKNANTFLAENGMLYGQAKVGRILAKAGLIVSIIMMVFWLIYIIAIGSVIGSVATYY